MDSASVEMLNAVNGGTSLDGADASHAASSTIRSCDLASEVTFEASQFSHSWRELTQCVEESIPLSATIVAKDLILEDVEAPLEMSHIHCLASGHVDDQMKLYLYAKHVNDGMNGNGNGNGSNNTDTDKEVMLLVELACYIGDHRMELCVKCSDASLIAPFIVYLKDSLRELLK